MKTILPILGIALAFSTLSAPAQEAAPVLLKAKLVVGKTYTYRQTMEMKMQLPLGGAGESVTKMLMDLKLTSRRRRTGKIS